MKLVPTNKAVKLNKADRHHYQVNIMFHQREMRWFSDPQIAERVQLQNLQNGDRFRFLNKYGKPYGPRWTVVFDMEDYREKYGGWSKYMPFCSMYFVKDGDTTRYHIGHKETVVVKPVHGNAMAVLAKLHSFANHNYFPA